MNSHNVLGLLNDYPRMNITFITADEKSTLCHASILKLFAPEFYTFVEPMNINAPIDFSVKIKTRKVLTEVIHFVYADNLPSSTFKVPFLIDILKASDYLNLIKLKLTVESMLCTKIDVSNCALLIQLSFTLTAEMLFECCLNFFRLPGMSKRVVNEKSKSWESLNLSNLEVSYPGLQSIVFEKLAAPTSIQSIPIAELSIAAEGQDEETSLSRKRKRIDDEKDSIAISVSKMNISNIRDELQRFGFGYSDIDGNRGVIEKKLDTRKRFEEGGEEIEPW